MSKLFDVTAFVGALFIAWEIHHEPEWYTLLIASGLIVVGGFYILVNDIKRWSR